MKIINHTRYDTRELRRVLCAVHVIRSKWEGGPLPQWRYVKFECVSARQRRGMSGYAYLGGTYSRLRLRSVRRLTGAQRELYLKRGFELPTASETYGEMIGIAWHEMQHLGRYKHGAGCEIPPGAAAQTLERLGVRFDAELPLKREPSVVPAAVRGEQLRQSRYEHAKRQLAQWQTKVKRAATFEKRWRGKVRYYERTLGVSELPQAATGPKKRPRRTRRRAG